MKRVVVLGAGTGGTLTANLLVHHLSREVAGGGVSVQLIGEGPDHVFQPANLDIAFKGADPGRAVRSERSLLHRRVDHLVDGARKVDLEDRSVLTRRGSRVEYDVLVLATGAVAAPNAMPGLAEGSLNFHSGPANAARIWSALQTFKRGRVLVTVAGVPHKCPPSPNEAAFMLDEFFRKRGLRRSVEVKFLTPYPRAYPAQKVSEVVDRLFEERGIELVPFFSADSVDPVSRKLFSLEGEAHEFDLLIAVPPHRGAEVVRASGIGDEEGWIPTDRRTMRMERHSDVYALGDATNIPISKSGVVAHLQAGIVAENVISDLTGATEQLEYNGRINCPMETGRRRALFVSGTYSEAPAENEPTFVRYVMKRSFSRMYWSAVRGGWGWLFDEFFGETSRRVAREAPLAQVPVSR